MIAENELVSVKVFLKVIWMNFQDKMRERLSEYKKKKFPDVQDGLYQGRPYGHIFPKGEQNRNLIEYYHDDILKNPHYRKEDLHIYFNHLNSTEALSFNFFFPLLIEKKLELLTSRLTLEEKAVNYETAVFEKPGIDFEHFSDSIFDFYFETAAGKKICFRTKYTETGFGSAEDDAIHSELYEYVYKNYLSVITEKYRKKSEFLQRFQICRTLLHLDQNTVLVIIYPRENHKIREEAEKAAHEILVPELRSCLILFTWEELTEYILKNSVSPKKFQNQYKEFAEKYFPE